MTGPVFVDTNVFVYLHDDSAPAKQLRANDWITCLVRRRAGRLSFQVLQELYSVFTRKVQPALAASRVQPIIRDLTSWRPIPIDFAIMERAWLMEGRYSLSWWDALIVAAAQTCQCKVLLRCSTARNADRGLAARPGIRRGPGDRSFRVAGADAASVARRRPLVLEALAP